MAKKKKKEFDDDQFEEQEHEHESHVDDTPLTSELIPEEDPQEQIDQKSVKKEVHNKFSKFTKPKGSK